MQTITNTKEDKHIEAVMEHNMVPNKQEGQKKIKNRHEQVSAVPPMQQFLLNHPSISITPSNTACSTQKNHSSTTESQIVPVRDEPTKNSDKDEETTNYKEVCTGPSEKSSPSGVKRFSTSQISNKPKKVPKINVYKADALHQKDYPSGLTSTKTNRVPQEPTITHSIEDLNLAENNCIMIPNTSMCVCIQMTDELDKTKIVISSKVRNRMYSALFKIIEEEDKEEFAKSDIKINCLQPTLPSKINQSLEMKDSKLNSANSNNISLAIINHGIKSNTPEIPYQQPSTSKQWMMPVHISPTHKSSVVSIQPQPKQSVPSEQPTTSKQSVVPQQSTTTKQSVVPQQSTTSKQSVVPQQSTTSKQSVVPEQPTTSKQSVVPEQPTTSKQSVVSVTQLPLVIKQLITQPSLKPTVACLSPQLQHVTNCCKTCNSVMSDNGDCQTCHMSKLKGITVTRINEIFTQQINDAKEKNQNIDEEMDNNIDKDQDKDQSKDKDTNIDKDKDEDNMLIDKPCINLISSDDEDYDNVESTEIIQNYISKLKTNPKLLEDKLCQKNLSRKNFFKFKQKNTIAVHIGNFTTSSVASGDVFICLHGVRMTVHGLNMNPVTIDVPIENIIQIVGFYGGPSTLLLIYINNLTTIGIRLLLNMTENNKMHNFDPFSKDNTVQKILWFFDIKNRKLQQLQKLLLKLPKGKYSTLSNAEAQLLFQKSQRKEECKQFLEFKSVKDYESYQLTDVHLDDRVVTPVKICDYRMLNIDVFVNDTIVEFYLNYWYCRKLSLEDRMRTYLFDSFFYTSLSTRKVCDVKTKSRHDRVKKWTKKVNIFEKDFIFIPINENFHWFMAVICYPHLTGPVHYEDGTPLKILYEDDFGDYERPSAKPCEPYAERDEADGNTEDFRYYPNFSHDVKNTGNYKTDVENLKKKNRIPIKQPVILIFDSLNGHTARARIVATLREWISEEYRTKHNGAERDFSLNSMKGTVVKVPQQPNLTDCGLFVMHYFQKFFECPIIDYSCPILHLENWFSIDDVSENCLKRREVQSIILKVMNEQGRSLPSGILLPELRFSKPIKNYYNNQGRDVNMELDNVGEEMYGEYAYHGNEYHQEYMEASQDDDCQEDDSQEEGDYQSNYRSDFDMEQSNTFNGYEVSYHSVHTPRNHNHQNIAGNSMASYNENDVDLYEEVEEEEEDEEEDDEEETYEQNEDEEDTYDQNEDEEEAYEQYKDEDDDEEVDEEETYEQNEDEEETYEQYKDEDDEEEVDEEDTDKTNEKEDFDEERR